MKKFILIVFIMFYSAVFYANVRSEVDSLPKRTRTADVYSLFSFSESKLTDLKHQDSIRLNLFHDVEIKAALEKIHESSNSFSWAGKIEGNPLSLIVITVSGGSIAGSINDGKKTYSISRINGGKITVSEVTPSLEPMDEESFLHMEPYPLPDNDFFLLPPPIFPSTIDLMILYTPQAKKKAEDDGQDIKTGIINSVNVTNQIFADSNINVTINIAHIEPLSCGKLQGTFIDGECDYGMTELKATLNSKIDNNNDGYVDYIPELMDLVGADKVAVITGNVHGSATFSSIDNSPRPFYVHSDYNAGNYTFTHELGHTLGTLHDYYVIPIAEMMKMVKEEKICKEVAGDSNYILTGNTAPNDSDGEDGDYFFSQHYYYIKDNGEWTKIGRFVGGRGNPDNSNWDNGDYYRDYGTSIVGLNSLQFRFYVKEGESWNRITLIHQGSGTPNSDLGEEGEYYRDSVSNNFYRKDLSSWNIIEVIEGAGAPESASGNDGDYFFDGWTYVDYYKKEGGEWSLLFSIYRGDFVPEDALGDDGDIYWHIIDMEVYEKENDIWINKSDTTYPKYTPEGYNYAYDIINLNNSQCFSTITSYGFNCKLHNYASTIIPYFSSPDNDYLTGYDGSEPIYQPMGDEYANNVKRINIVAAEEKSNRTKKLCGFVNKYWCRKTVYQIPPFLPELPFDCLSGPIVSTCDPNEEITAHDKYEYYLVFSFPFQFEIFPPLIDIFDDGNLSFWENSYTTTDDTITIREKTVPDNIVSVTASSRKDVFAIAKDPKNELYTVLIDDKNSHNKWNRAGDIVNSKLLNKIEAFGFYENEMFIVDNPNEAEESDRKKLLYKAVKGRYGEYRLQHITYLPETISSIAFHSLKDGLYITGVEKNSISLYKVAMDYSRGKLIHISSKEQPEARDFYSYYANNDTIYLAGGVTLYGNEVSTHQDIWRFTPRNGWAKIAKDIAADLTKVLIQEKDRKLYLTSKKISDKQSVEQWIFDLATYKIKKRILSVKTVKARQTGRLLPKK